MSILPDCKTTCSGARPSLKTVVRSNQVAMPRGRSKSPVPKGMVTTSSAPSAPDSSGVPSAGYLLTCDPPAKQFIKHLNETKRADKKFVIEDLDATHLLIKGSTREEILRKIEEWMDENVWTSVERVGESLDTS